MLKPFLRPAWMLLLIGGIISVYGTYSCVRQISTHNQVAAIEPLLDIWLVQWTPGDDANGRLSEGIMRDADEELDTYSPLPDYSRQRREQNERRRLYQESQQREQSQSDRESLDSSGLQIPAIGNSGVSPEELERRREALQSGQPYSYHVDDERLVEKYKEDLVFSNMTASFGLMLMGLCTRRLYKEKQPRNDKSSIVRDILDIFVAFTDGLSKGLNR